MHKDDDSKIPGRASKEGLGNNPEVMLLALGPPLRTEKCVLDVDARIIACDIDGRFW